MKDASAKRRSLGKLGILTAAAIILPLTATIVPAISAQDDTTTPAAAGAPKITKMVKVIKINKDGETVDITGHDGDGKEVTKIVRDGKIFIFRTDKKLSQEQVEKMIEKAQESREAALEASVEAEEARGEAEAGRTEAEAAWGDAKAVRANAEAASAHAEAMRVHAVAMAANYIPEIDIKEITKNCKDGQPVTTDVSGFDGQSKAKIKIVMCEKWQAKLARKEALRGLKDAQSEIANDQDIPPAVRRDVLEKLKTQVRKLEGETAKN